LFESRLVEEPRGDVYRTLLDALQPHAHTFLLVAREQLQLSDAGIELFQRLQPARQQRVRTTAWPGTELVGQFAQVDRYPVTAETVGVLKTSVDGLYEWRQPERPEDLCFLDDRGDAILTTIAHGREAWVMLPMPALDALRTKVGRRYFGEPERRERH
jgi:hypothetical protein